MNNEMMSLSQREQVKIQEIEYGSNIPGKICLFLVP
jgi:hypothetical protein